MGDNLTTKTHFSGVLGNLRTGQLSNPSPSRSPALTADNLSAVRRADLRPTREGVATRPACPLPITRRRTCRRSPANVCADHGRATRPRVRSPANVPRGFQKVSQCFQKSPFRLRPLADTYENLRFHPSAGDSLSGNYQILSKTIQNRRFGVSTFQTFPNLSKTGVSASGTSKPCVTPENSRKLPFSLGAPRPDLPRTFSRSRIFYLTCANGK